MSLSVLDCAQPSPTKGNPMPDKHGWIKCSERMPPRNSRVFVWGSGYKMHSNVFWKRTGLAEMVFWFPGESFTDEFGWSIETYKKALADIGADHIDITHWQPLPNPPDSPESTDAVSDS